MDTLLIIGTSAITAALIAYSIAIITEQVKRKVNKFILTFLSTGLFLDFLATSTMIYRSSDSIITLHGVLGYSALLAMIIDTYLIWKNYLKDGENISNKIHRYSLIAYIYWLSAFTTGTLLVMVGNTA